MRKISIIIRISYAVLFTVIYFSGAAIAGNEYTLYADKAPSLISPPDNYVFKGRELITFVFSLGSYDKVRLMIDDNINFSSTIVDLETDQTSEQVELPTGIYYWKVKGIGGLELESSIRIVIVL